MLAYGMHLRSEGQAIVRQALRVLEEVDQLRTLSPRVRITGRRLSATSPAVETRNIAADSIPLVKTHQQQTLEWAPPLKRQAEGCSRGAGELRKLVHGEFGRSRALSLALPLAIILQWSRTVLVFFPAWALF